MESRIWLTVTLAIAVLGMAAHGEEKSPWDPDEGGTAAQQSAKLVTLDDLVKLLLDTRAGCGDLDISSADLYLDAQARIEVARPAVAKKPDSDEARAVFSACSLATVAAVAQMEARREQATVVTLQAEENDVLSQLNQIHEKINSIERSHASKLKGELDEARESARKLREEADKKFQELQSSLIQVTNDARGTIISMSDILFKTGKADLTTDLKTSLAKIAGILLVFKNSTVIVEGHTDNQGSEEYNQLLSEHRADNVMDFLIEQGLSPSRLRATGYGFSRPVADNETAEGRRKNRRVDLIVQERKPAD